MPRVSVILPHFNYARFVAGAISSVIEQSMTEWELIVVDDHSSEREFEAVSEIVSSLKDERIRLVRNEENIGQIGAIFKGIDIATGDFIALLDPDDLYEPAFLQTMLTALLNPVVNAGLVTCEMGVFNKSTGVIARHSTSFRLQAVKDERYDEYTANMLLRGYSEYFPPWIIGWIWSATSGMMFRKSVLEAIRPARQISFTRFEGDSYCAIGCHMIAGTLFVDQLLSWRGVHESNTAKSPVVIFEDDTRLRPDFVNTLREVKLALAETILSGSALPAVAGPELASSVLAHIGHEGGKIVAERSAAARDTLFRYSIGGA